MQSLSLVCVVALVVATTACGSEAAALRSSGECGALPSDAGEHGLETTLRFPEEVGPETLGLLTVKNGSARTLALTVHRGPSVQSVMVQDGRVISTGAIDAAIGASPILRPGETAKINVFISGVPCDAIGQEPRRMPPPGSYRVHARFRISDAGAAATSGTEPPEIMSQAATVNWDPSK